MEDAELELTEEEVALLIEVEQSVQTRRAEEMIKRESEGKDEEETSFVPREVLESFEAIENMINSYRPKGQEDIEDTGKDPTLPAARFLANGAADLVDRRMIDQVLSVQEEALAKMTKTTGKLRSFNNSSEKKLSGTHGDMIATQLKEIGQLIGQLNRISTRINTLETKVKAEVEKRREKELKFKLAKATTATNKMEDC